ncbi:MAG: polysaccharide biosynthesis/export family protein, partial [Lentisphaerae bacterium]|nr:polysaccharide biosynthesis/export family protein [Lentisphaerota bacterium]
VALAKTEAGAGRESTPDTALPDQPIDRPPFAASPGDAGESAGEAPPSEASALKPAELPVYHEGDDIEVFVSEDPGFNGVYKIRQGGYVVIPQVGQFMVAGKTQAEAQKALKERLELNLLKKATVAIMLSTAARPSGGGVVYVIGEVSKPGPLQIPKNETLTMLTAVLRAGALGEHADPAQVQLARLKGGRRDISLMNFDAVLKGYEAGTELALRDGDIVNVIGREGIDLQKEPPPSRGTVYLNGRVREPGPHDIKDLTVFRTLLRYGGFDRFANLKKVYVLRMERGSQLKIPVNIKAIRDKGALELDIPVKPGDIIVVPEKFFSF